MQLDNFLRNKTIAITGGTGSFGQNLIRRLVQCDALSKIIIFSRDELKQFEMQQQFSDPRLRFLLGDVRDRERLVRAFRNVDIVIHAAALKQVPAAEYNPDECIKTNIVGATNVIDAALENNVDRVLALSTDKASSPVNLYGATKLVSDKLFVAANNMRGDKQTKFSVVRYGNVARSRGSVIPFFEKLLKQGVKSLPVTHPDMTRFWITLDESIRFVLDNLYRMHGGEIFIPKIPSIRIVDLAEAMLPQHEITISGIRPGEKLHEEMIPSEISQDTVEFENFFIIKPAIRFTGANVDYATTMLGEIGQPVSEGFSYCSGKNPDFMTVDQIRDYVGGTRLAAE